MWVEFRTLTPICESGAQGMVEGRDEGTDVCQNQEKNKDNR